ncbi:MAG: glycosyltransferase [Clostridium sp.]|nr:glycosyltransferase [Clostridium sp.]
MNMLFISASFPLEKSGIGDSAEKLLSEFDNLKDVNTTLLTTSYPEIKEFINSSKYKDKSYFFEDWNFSLKKISVVKKLISEKNIDVIHIDYPGGAYKKGLFVSILPLYIRVSNLLRKKKIKVNLRLHEFTKARLLRKIVVVLMLIFSNKIFIPALHDYKTVKKVFGNKVKKTLIGSNIETNKLSKDVDEEFVNLAYFGFVYHNKGVEKLIDIFKDIKSIDKEKKFKFTIMGEIKPGEENDRSRFHKMICQLIKDSGLENDIRITGYLSNDDVIREMSKVDIAVLPFDDGLSLRRGSFLAFLGNGVPIVTTDGDDECHDMFEHASGIFMGKSKEEIIETILSWSKDKDKLIEKGKENQRLSENFRWDKIAEDMIKEY